MSVIDKPEPNPKPKSALELFQQKHQPIANDLESLFDGRKMYSDVVLVSGETEFSSLKLILSMSSPVFDAMLDECEEMEQDRVVITDIEPKVLAELLMYIYTGTVSSFEKYSDELLVAADKYQMESLKLNCEEWLSFGLTTESAVKLLILSDKHNASILKANCLEYISRHSTEVTEEHWKAVISASHGLGLELFKLASNKK